MRCACDGPWDNDPPCFNFWEACRRCVTVAQHAFARRVHTGEFPFMTSATVASLLFLDRLICNEMSKGHNSRCLEKKRAHWKIPHLYDRPAAKQIVPFPDLRQTKAEQQAAQPVAALVDYFISRSSRRAVAHKTRFNYRRRILKKRPCLATK